MLIDDKDLFVLANESSRKYFREILQAYYNQNYRAAVVMLYAFVMYDLLQKLKIMAQEGDEKAENKLSEIRELIKNDDKYSNVEKEICLFFKKRCSLYFRNFDTDIELLKSYRDKCAHLNLNDDVLFEPKDYQARMLICSMFDNVLSAKAPFIRDLFEFVKDEIERYDNTFLFSISVDGIDQKIVQDLSIRFFRRLTADSIKRSYSTFIKLLFNSNNCKFIKGLYVFTYSMTDFLVSENTKIILDDTIKQKINAIEVDELNRVESRKDALISLVYNFPQLLDLIEQDSELFNYLVENIVKKPKYFHKYGDFFARNRITAFAFFKENVRSDWLYYIEQIYDVVYLCEDFDLGDYVKIMVDNIPTFNGFDSADNFTKFFISKLQDLTESSIVDVLNVYFNNKQCLGRRSHADDIQLIKDYCSKSNIIVAQFNPVQSSECNDELLQDYSL